MDDLKFNIYAMVKPTTRTEYMALLQEAIMMIEDVNDILEEILNTPHRPTPGN